MRIAVLLLALFLCACPAGAMEVVDVEDVTSCEFYLDDGYVYTMIIVQGVDPERVSEFIVNSETYILEVNITHLNYYSSVVDASFYDRVSGNSSEYSETWYHILPIDTMYFQIGSGNYLFEGTVTGGVRVSRLLSDEIVFAPSNFTFSSDSPVNLRLFEMAVEESGSISLTDTFFSIIGGVPYVGPYIVDTLRITSAVVSTFFTTCWLVIENWAVLLLAFETFVLLRAITILQGRGKHSKKLSKAIVSIVSDNRVLFEFLINAFSRILELVFSAVKAIGSWVPFT